MAVSPDQSRAKDVPIHSIQIDFTTYYALQTPDLTFDKPPALVIALHGYAQRCQRFIRDFAPLRDRNVLIAAPQAPSQFYFRYEPERVVGFSWLTMFEKENSINDFVSYMRRLLDRVYEQHVYDRDRVFILGFSQGVSMAYRFAVRGGIQVAGVIACCADLPPDVEQVLPDQPAFPVLILHGKDDPLVPVEKALAAEEALKNHGFDVEAEHFGGGHELKPDQAVRVGNWIDAH